MPPSSPRSLLITGASSGLGEALARVYAAPGVALALSGRDRARLDAVAEACRAMGAAVETAVLDVADARAMEEWIAAADDRAPLDLVIANAGISGGTGVGTEPAEQVRSILRTNVEGVLNTVLPAIPRMRARRSGQIGLMSSLAGYRGLPGAAAYCASKAAVKAYGEALRGQLAAHGVGVTVICPGFVKSRMTAVNRFRMPFLMDGPEAARIIRRGLERNRPRVAFPWPMASLAWFLAALPPGAVDRIATRLPRKGAPPKQT